MADDPKKRGKADRSRVSSQPHELKYQAAKKRRAGAEAKSGSKAAREGGKK
jgi:hypothetical protein